MDFKFPYFSWHVPLSFSKGLYFGRNKALSASLFWVSNFTILSAILLLLDLRKDSYCLYLEILRNGVSNKRTFLHHEGYLQKIYRESSCQTPYSSVHTFSRPISQIWSNLFLSNNCSAFCNHKWTWLDLLAIFRSISWLTCFLKSSCGQMTKSLSHIFFFSIIFIIQK